MVGQFKKSRNILYKILVQDPNMEQIGKIVKRVVGIKIQLWIHYTLEMMELVLWWVGSRMILVLG